MKMQLEKDRMYGIFGSVTRKRFLLSNMAALLRLAQMLQRKPEDF